MNAADPTRLPDRRIGDLKFKKLLAPPCLGEALEAEILRI